jgi:hypothetical protein
MVTHFTSAVRRPLSVNSADNCCGATKFNEVDFRTVRAGAKAVSQLDPRLEELINTRDKLLLPRA